MTNLRDDARWLVDQVAEAKAMAKALGKPQLGTSSIESGKIEEYDSEGTLTQIIGEQYDGTHIAVSVSGPTPPEPLAATATVGLGSAELRWNGKFAEGAMSPMDFSHVSAHGSRLAVFSPDNTTKLADIAGESGDVATVLLEPGEWTIGLVAVSKSGKWSEMSETITVDILDFPSPLDMQQELIDLDVKMDGAISESGNLGLRLTQAETDLVAHDGRLAANDATLNTLTGTTLPALSADLAAAKAQLAPLPGLIADNTTKVNAAKSRLDTLDSTTLPALNADLTAAKARLTTAEGTLAPLPGKVATAQSDLVTAFGQISTADGKAVAAQTKADTAFADAAAAAGIANGKGKVIVQSTAPAAADRNAVTLWIDTTGNLNTPKRWTTGTTWVAVTDKVATDAAAAAVTAQTAATNAASAAAAADSKAVAAQTAASTAQTAADNAATDAAAAAGIANGKGKVLVQSTAPAAADRNAVTLWIDTTGGANTPKRWSTGTTWVAVTDKAATDAATAAANAASAAAAAQAAAGTAQTTANSALTMAGSKGKVFYDTAAPSGSGTAAGDLWRRIDASKNVIGEWYWTGSAWQSSLITTSAISNLDVGKLTAGAAVIDSAVINKMAIAIATVIELNADRITAGQITAAQIDVTNLAASIATVISLNASRITAGTIATARLDVTSLSAAIATIISLNADRITAGTIDTARLNVTTLAASIATIISLNADRITAGTINTARLNTVSIAAATASIQTVDVRNLFVTTGTMAEAVIKKLFADVVMSRKITAQMLAIGAWDNLLGDGQFLDTTTGGWSGTKTMSPTGGRFGGGTLTLPTSESQSGCYYLLAARTDERPVLEPGRKYRLSVQVQSTVTIPAGGVCFYLRLYAEGATTGNIFASPSKFNNTAAIPANTWGTITGVFTVPADQEKVYAVVGVFSQSVFTTGPSTWSNASLMTMSDGSLVVDGSIKAVSIDVDDLVADAGYIAKLTAKIVKADMFVGKEFIGAVFTGAVIQSPAGGAGYQLTENGYTSRDEAGNVTVRLPADGSPAQFKGDVEAQSLTASGRVSMQAPGNEIASGATLILEAGVTPPLTPPTVGTAYTTVPLAPLPAGESAAGLAYAQGLWWRGVRRTADALGRIEGINSSGIVVVSQEIVEDPVHGLTAIGNTLYLLGTRNARPVGERWVVAYSVTTTTVTWSHFWQYTDYGTGAYQPGIGISGSNILIGQVRINGPLTWRTFNSTTGALVSQIDSTFIRRDDVVGIVQTTGDFGATRVVVAFRNAVTETFTTAGVNTGPSESWYSAGRNPNLGIVWQGGAFWQYAAQQGVIKYSGIKDPTGAGGRDTDDWWIAATWRGVGGIETTMGPPQRFTFMRRAELQLAAGTRPAGVTGVRFYLARKVTAPTRADMHLLATVTGTTARIATLPANWETLASPPAANTFSATSPGQIRSRADNFQIGGDGSGKWGPLTFHPDGTMTSNAVPAWIPITSFQSGCTVGDFGFVPAYRSWPDGKVEMRGVIKGTLNIVKPIFALPAAVRSAHPVNFVAATNAQGNVPAVMRIEIGSVENPDFMTIQPQGTTRTWISIDGLYYYQV